MKKQNIMPIAVLTVICLAVALLLGAVNMLTAPVIEKMEEQKKYDSLRKVLDGEFSELEELPEGAPDTVTAMYEVKEGGKLKGNVVLVEVKGYAGTISMTVGVLADGSVTKVIVTDESETKKTGGIESYPDKFEGVSSDGLAAVDLISGVTVTSGAIKGGVIDAVNAVTGGNISAGGGSSGDTSTGSEPETLPRLDGEIISRIMELVPGATDLESVSLWQAPETLKRLYRVIGGKGGYVAYVLTKGEYVPVANEGLVYINTNGDIESIEHLTWVVGNNVSAEGFADKFVGKDNWHVGDVELVSNATVTSGDFRNAVADALDVVTKMLARTDEKVLELTEELVPNAGGFERLELSEDAPESLKALYRAEGGFGYVAYIVTPGDYVAVATESLIHFNTEGKIVGAKLLVWNVGHGVPAGDFADRFIGATKDTVAEVELVTAATGTSVALRDAVAAAFDYVPTDFPAARVVGIAVLVLAFAAAAAAVIIVKKRRAVK